MKYLWIVFFLLAYTSSSAQQKATLQTPAKWAFRFNPLGLIDGLDGNLSLGLEHFFNNRFSITTDVAFIFYSDYIPENKRALGYIVKPAVRFYSSDAGRLFLEASVFYKRVGYKVEDWLGKECVNDVPAFEQFETFIFRKQVAGINAVGGWRRDLTRTKVLRMELYVGIGIRYKWQDIKNDPRACYQISNIFDAGIYETNFLAPSIPHGLRLVYNIQ